MKTMPKDFESCKVTFEQQMVSNHCQLLVLNILKRNKDAIYCNTKWTLTPNGLYEGAKVLDYKNLFSGVSTVINQTLFPFVSRYEECWVFLVCLYLFVL